MPKIIDSTIRVPGFSIPMVIPMNIEKPYVTIGTQKLQEIKFLSSDKVWPASLTCVCGIALELLEQKNVAIEVQRGDGVSLVKSLYDVQAWENKETGAQSRVKALRLIFEYTLPTRANVAPVTLDKNSGDILYEITFQHEHKHKRVMSEEEIKVPTPYPYGGYYHKQHHPNTWGQIYYTVSIRSEQISIGFMRSDTVFLSPDAREKTLAEVIEEGLIDIAVSFQEHTAIYKSTSYSRDISGKLKITFIPVAG